MGPVRVVRFSELSVSRWANGLGETVELWRMPEDGDFALRLSIATVGSDAPFSELPGVDRALMALAPAGLTLEIDDAEHPLARYGVARFAGEASVRALGVTEPGHDLNLMVRRGAGAPELGAVRIDGTQLVQRPGPFALVALAGELSHGGAALAFGDAILAPDGGRIEVHGTGVLAEARLA